MQSFNDSCSLGAPWGYLRVLELERKHERELQNELEIRFGRGENSSGGGVRIVSSRVRVYPGHSRFFTKHLVLIHTPRL